MGKDKNSNIIPIDPNKVKEFPVNKNGNPIVISPDKIPVVIDPLTNEIKLPLEDPLPVNIYNEPINLNPNLTDLNNIPMICMKKDLLHPLSKFVLNKDGKIVIKPDGMPMEYPYLKDSSGNLVL